MPYRKSPLITNEIYHVFNRSIGKTPIFNARRDYQRALNSIWFYRYRQIHTSFSHFLNFSANEQQTFIASIAKLNSPSVEILAFCIMPNHIHLLIKQTQDDGISSLMRKFQHSYSKYFNIKNKRTGSLFQAMFKAVRIQSDEQLLHVSRYIHLNPVTSFLINKEQLKDYQWSSYGDYISSSTSSLVKRDLVLSFFKTGKEYEEFVLDNADYQRALGRIKHLVFE